MDKNKKEDKSESESETEEEKDIDIFKNIKIPDNFFKNKKRKRSPDKKEKEIFKNKDKIDKKTENAKFINKDIKLNDKNEEANKIKLPDLDPESDEYWLELRKRIGIN